MTSASSSKPNHHNTDTASSSSEWKTTLAAAHSTYPVHPSEVDEEEKVLKKEKIDEISLGRSAQAALEDTEANSTEDVFHQALMTLEVMLDALREDEENRRSRLEQFIELSRDPDILGTLREEADSITKSSGVSYVGNVMEVAFKHPLELAVKIFERVLATPMPPAEPPTEDVLKQVYQMLGFPVGNSELRKALLHLLMYEDKETVIFKQKSTSGSADVCEINHAEAVEIVERESEKLNRPKLKALAKKLVGLKKEFLQTRPRKSPNSMQ